MAPPNPNAPPQLPPETYTHLIRALLSLQSSVPHAYPPPTYPYPTPPNYYYPWPPDTASVATPPIPLLPHAAPQTTGLAPPAASTSQDPEGTEDATSTAQDKRRRNTAASARFRVKKKLKTSNLERAVADLTGRTEDLEREANDLRRENAWLKEIVLLKGRNLASLNLGSQAPELASTVRRRERGKDEES
ncbi:hypothetical protein HD554DRAFT_2062579 [Boletus coccyginus]|nr:hypothetical protein HD554DRAFT_2062579 [Boletus coccyginus]